MPMLDNLHSMLALTCLVLAAFGLGRPVVWWLMLDDGPLAETAVWSVGLGLPIGGLLLAMMTWLGWLHVATVALITLLACIAGVVALYFQATFPKPATSGWDGPAEQCETPGQSPPRWLLIVGAVLVGAGTLGSFVNALAPPIATDAICGELRQAKRTLSGYREDTGDGSRHGVGASRQRVGLGPTWCAWAMALDGPVAAGLLRWAMVGLLAASTAILARPILGGWWALIAGGLVMSIPRLGMLDSLPVEQLALAALTTLAVAAWYRGAVLLDSRRWFLVAGFLIGVLLTLGAIALSAVLAIGVAWYWRIARRPELRRPLLLGVRAAALTASVVAAVWYAPVLGQWRQDQWRQDGATIMGQAERSESHCAADSGGTRDARPTLQPWDAVASLGALSLAFVPGVLLCRRLPGLATLLAVAAVYAGIAWATSIVDSWPPLLPIAPLLLIAVAWVWREMGSWPTAARRALATAGLGLVAVALAPPIARCPGRVPVALGLESRDAYLVRNEPTYPAAAIANRLLPPDARLMSLDDRTFYFHCHTLTPAMLEQPLDQFTSGQSSDPLTRRLRRSGITHLLLVAPEDPDARRSADAWQALTAPPRGQLPADVELITEYRHRDTAGEQRRYRLMALRPGRMVRSLKSADTLQSESRVR